MVKTNKHGGRAGGREEAIGNNKRRGGLNSRESGGTYFALGRVASIILISSRCCA
jgi:hypothetical protein